MQRTIFIGTKSDVLAALHAAGVGKTLEPEKGSPAGGRMNRVDFTVEQFIEELRRVLRRPRGDIRIVSDQRGSVAGGPVVVRVCSNLRVVVRTLRPEGEDAPARSYPVYSVGYENTSDTRVLGRKSAAGAARMIARAYPAPAEHSLRDVIEVAGEAA